MKTAKIFENGRSQAVRLPKEYRFEEDEVYINKIGNVIMLIPKNDPWAGAFAAADAITPDFMAEGRPEFPEQEKEEL